MCGPHPAPTQHFKSSCGPGPGRVADLRFGPPGGRCVRPALVVPPVESPRRKPTQQPPFLDWVSLAGGRILEEPLSRRLLRNLRAFPNTGQARDKHLELQAAVRPQSPAPPSSGCSAGHHAGRRLPRHGSSSEPLRAFRGPASRFVTWPRALARTSRRPTSLGRCSGAWLSCLRDFAKKA